MSIYEELKVKYPEVEEYCIESGDWEDIAVVEFKKGNYEIAEENFEKVIVAIPDHFNGYEMGAYAKHMLGKTEEATLYMKKAIEVALSFDGDAAIDQDVIDDMIENLGRIECKAELNMEYIDEIMED